MIYSSPFLEIAYKWVQKTTACSSCKNNLFVVSLLFLQATILHYRLKTHPPVDKEIFAYSELQIHASK